MPSLKMIYFIFSLMKFTSLQFGVKFDFPRFLQNKMYMSLMVLHVFFKNENFIDAIEHEII
jgi:hypothetical protein